MRPLIAFTEFWLCVHFLQCAKAFTFFACRSAKLVGKSDHGSFLLRRLRSSWSEGCGFGATSRRLVGKRLGGGNLLKMQSFELKACPKCTEASVFLLVKVNCLNVCLFKRDSLERHTAAISFTGISTAAAFPFIRLRLCYLVLVRTDSIVWWNIVGLRNVHNFVLRYYK